MSAPAPDNQQTQYSYPDWLAQAGNIPKGQVGSSVGIPDYSKVNWPTKEEMENLSTEALCTMVFMAATQFNEANLNADREKLRYYNDLLAGSNVVYNDASNSRTEANQKESSANTDDALIAFAQAHGIKIESGKEYSKEDWDIHLQSIQAVQDTWIQETKLVSIDVEKNLNKAANSMQFLTAAIDSIQKRRDTVNQNLIIR
ncbi:MAG: hypothetical protein V4629_10565 [Pseudomonadota bacterium]